MAFEYNEKKHTNWFAVVYVVIAVITVALLVNRLMSDAAKELKKENENKPLNLVVVVVDNKEYTNIDKDSISPPLHVGGQIDFKDKQGNEYHLKCNSYIVKEDNSFASDDSSFKT